MEIIDRIQGVMEQAVKDSLVAGANLLVEHRKGEYGWDGWLGVYFANFPEENMTILMGAQKKDGGTFSLTRKLRNLILSNF